MFELILVNVLGCRRSCSGPAGRGFLVPPFLILSFAVLFVLPLQGVLISSVALGKSFLCGNDCLALLGL